MVVVLWLPVGVSDSESPADSLLSGARMRLVFTTSGLVVAWLAVHQLPRHMQDCGYSSIMPSISKLTMGLHVYVLGLGKLNLSLRVLWDNLISRQARGALVTRLAACVWRSGGCTNTMWPAVTAQPPVNFGPRGGAWHVVWWCSIFH
jgi:hypothetical protein